MLSVFLVIRAALAVLALFLVNHFIIQCGTVPLGGDTCPLRSQTTISSIITSATANSRCDGPLLFGIAHVCAFVVVLVLTAHVCQALRSRPNAVRREGTLEDSIWS